ncbi:hypothetical protein [Nocardioides pacificus]
MTTKWAWRIAAVGLVLGVGTGIAYALVAGGDNDSSESTSQPTGSASPSVEPAPAQEDAWREVARSYAVAFTNTSGGHQAWLERLRPLISPALADSYEWTDLRNIPSVAFTDLSGGALTPSETPTREVELRYSDGLVVDVRVSQDPASGRWVVTTAVPANPTSGEA